MDKQELEKEYSSDDDQPKTFWEKVYQIFRSNWLAFFFALIIALLTIIVVPIIYSLGHTTSTGNSADYAWNVTGKTVVNQLTTLDGSTNALGLLSALAIDIYDNIYIVDKTKHRILKYSIADETLTLFAGYPNGTSGSDDSSFNSPNDIFISTDGSNIYIADTLNHRIQLWTTTSTKGSTVCGRTGEPGPVPNNLNNPMAVTMDGDLNIYIADYGNNQVVQCNQNNKQLTILIEAYNNAGNRNSYVLTPISIKYHSYTNSLVIAQQHGYNVIRWSLNGNNTTSWTLIAGSASSELSGTSRTLFMALCHVNIDRNLIDDTNTYVADCINERIQMYRGDLTQGSTIAGVIQAAGTNPYLFNYPTDVAFDSKMNLYVADSNNSRIQKFLQLTPI